MISPFHFFKKVQTITAETSPTICPLPFMHTYIKANGAIVACCESQETQLSKASDNKSFKEIWNNQNYTNLRRALIDGEKPEACKKCWINEKHGIQSNRQEAWERYREGLYKNGELQVNHAYHAIRPPTAIELKCNNLCNLKCRMCHPSSSFRIQEDRDVIDLYRPGLKWEKNVSRSQKTIDQLLKNNNDLFENLKVVQFSGGEPLISSEHIDFVKKLLKHHPENIQLRYSTNLTQLSYMNIDYPELWKNFRHTNIKISIDGVNDIYDYIRVGATFNKVVDNLNQLLSLNMKNLSVGIGFTTQAYNVFQLPEFLSFFEKIIPRQLITTHPLHDPELLAPTIYTDTIKERIIKKLKDQRADLEPTISLLNQSIGKPTLWSDFNKYTMAMEDKYNVKNGFHYLLEKYLNGY